MAVKLPFENVEKSPALGIFILMIIGGIAFVIFQNSATIIVFPLLLISVLALAASRGKGNVEEDLESVGVTGEGMGQAIIVGVIIGIVSLLIGSLIMTIMPEKGSFLELGSILIPVTATAAALGSATVIPSYLVTSTNILAQWTYVAPGEEAGLRVLTVFGLQSIFGNVIISFLGATLIWAALHIPLWMTTGVSETMYLIIVVWGIIWSIQFIVMRNFFSNVVSHATTNTGVILATELGFGGLNNIYVIGTVVAIILILTLLGWYYAKK